ncbi:hypothetical protein EZV62_018137 [Acer yangbiense]|uniref:Disease resistance protein At4g27190-like leucine-rich repeats domain-containing protein n=1 Tax=Acer yangbiense TaxID=1000413 RepID=A0A5C7HIY5_9ROSI|nr:hypothetical protein EZV62_018137 [Acer yangbiense]
MEEIFTTGRENEEIVWDKLHSLSLKKLPKLRSFYSVEEVASTSDQERQMIDTHMPLFDGKVKFRNLKTLQLSAINFEKMWHNQLPLKSSSFQNLTDLMIQNCCNMKYLFSSSTLGSFLQLQNLNIHNCTVLEEIIRIDDLGIHVELPSLKELSIKGCPEMKAFIFSDKVAFPSLEEIQIQYMDNLEMIWNNQLEDFLDNQYYIYVEECGIEEIVSKEEGEVADRTLVFPKLTSLSLYHLQELKCFHPGIYSTKWPMLKKLNAIGCDKINALELFGIQEVISDDQLDILVQEKVLPNLVELGLDGIKTRMVWQRQFPEILFPKLISLEILNDELAVLPPRILQRSHNLERLSLQDSLYEWIFSCEEVNEQAKIKSLHICKLHNLKQIWKQDSKVDAIHQNLENLVVRSCGSLVTLIPPSTSFQNLTILRVCECSLINLLSSSTVKSLMQLKEMEIGYCKMMTEVVTGDEVGIEEEINFKNLKSLELTSLSRITRFCFGNYNFNFPSLEKFNVVSCPKMKIFSSIAASTPMLRGIELDWEIYYCDGDLNTTMERIHEKKNAESSTKDCAGPSAQHLE